MLFSGVNVFAGHRVRSHVDRRSRLRRFAGITLLACTSGCALQPEIIQKRHWDLNETIRETTNEQLLLNLVRLRYDERPYFLQLSSITTSFSAGGSLGVSGTFPQGGNNTNDVYGVNGAISYSESPTVTWSIPDSREFLGRFYAPVGADQLAVLAQSGFNLVDVFRVGSGKINALRNREFEIVRGEFVPEGYERFVEALELIDALERDGLIDLSFVAMSAYGGPTMSLEQVDSRAVADGFPKLYFLERPENPGVVMPRALLNPLFVRFTLESDDDPRAQRVRELLKLDPDSYSFPITDTSTASPELLRSEDAQLSTVFDPDVRLRHIMLNNRSVMEILRFAAASVQVPEEDIERGVVRKRDVKLDEYLTVLWSDNEPKDAWLKVEYRGSWFYIPETDLNARASFSLLSALFASVVGQVPGAKPVLTLPVN